jgi:outer membrane autotransporter protein
LRDDDRSPLRSAPERPQLRTAVAFGVLVLAAAGTTQASAQTDGSSPTTVIPGGEASLYTAIPAMQRLHGRALTDTLHMRMGEQEQLRHFSSLNDDERIDGAWGRLIGWTGGHDGDGRGVHGPDGPAFDWDLYGLQLGLELYRERDPHDDPDTDDDESEERHHAGVTFAIARMDGEVEHFNGRAAGRNTLDAYSLGGYWTKFGPEGGYLDAVSQATWYDYRAQSARLPELTGDGFGAAVSVEIGKPFDLEKDQEVLNRGWIIEPQGQLIYQVFDEQGVEGVAAPVDFQDTESLLGRLGLRLANTWNVRGGAADAPRSGTVWGRFNAWYELMDPPKTVFSSEDGPVPFTADLGDKWLEVNAGVTAQLTNSSTLYVDAGYLWDTGERGDALHGRVGARWSW